VTPFCFPWDRVSEATPKPVLWVLPGLQAIAIGVLVALSIDSKRNAKDISTLAELPTESAPEPGYFKIYALFWDNDLNPHCPADETLLIIWTHDEKRAGGFYESLRCFKCTSRFPLRGEGVGLPTLAAMQ
jgi:hypothetical protein